jgi:hypothetical protein
MNRTVVILLAAFEAFLALAIGIGISLVPLTIMWAFRLDLGLGWDVFYRASADIWLAGHGVDLTVTLDPKLAAAVALPGADKPFLISIAPLLFAVLTALLGVRLGRKTIEAGARFVAPVAALATFGGLTVIVAITAIQEAAMPVMWMALSFPTIIFAFGMFIGARGELGRSGGRADRVQQRVVTWADGLPTHIRFVISASLAGGTAAAAAVVAFSGVVLAVLLVVNFSTIIRLYEGLQGGAGGGLILTAAQLMFMPNFVIWVASWFVGTGFAIGTGSLVSPVGTQLGLVPSLPILGALPTSNLAWGFLGILVPIAAGFAAALIIRPRLVHMLGGLSHLRWIAITVLGIGLVGGAVMGLLAWASGGAAGPGRLVDVGPNFWLTGLIAAAEFAVAAALGMLAGSRTPAPHSTHAS